MKRIAVVFVIVAALAGTWIVMQPRAGVTPGETENAPELAGDAIVTVLVPAAFNDQERIGERAFNAICAICHGDTAQGRQGVAPPLVHKTYEPNHHGDMAFLLAAQNGVRAHHWRFGDMPPVEGVTRADVLNIVAYIRALQRENGIN